MASSLSPTTKPSIATSFPYELVEAILTQIPLVDLLVISAHLPPFWRSVLETSTKLPHFLKTLRARRTSFFSWTILREGDTAIRCDVENGILLICRRRGSGDEGFLLIKDSATGPLLTILDPTSKSVSRIENPRLIYPKQSKARRNQDLRLDSIACITLRDLKGELVVERFIHTSPQRQHDPLVEYSQTCRPKSAGRAEKLARARAVRQFFESDLAGQVGVELDGAVAACDDPKKVYRPRMELPRLRTHYGIWNRRGEVDKEDDPMAKLDDPSAVVFRPPMGSWKKTAARQGT